MAEIKNYTLNFAVRRPLVAGLTCASRKLAAAEIELRLCFSQRCSFESGQ